MNTCANVWGKRMTRMPDYTYPEIKTMLEANGIKNIKDWGDTAGSSFHFDSRRMIILAKKK